MTRDEIVQGVSEVLSRYQGRGRKDAALTGATDLEEKLNANSAIMVDIVMDLEEKFGVTIDDTKMPKIETVSDVVSFVDGLVNAQK